MYESVTDSWSQATLSQPRYWLTATTVGTKAFFAGGLLNGSASNVVDIYDYVAGTWSTAHLSAPRLELTATTVGTTAIFAGGWDLNNASWVVDIYDSVSGTWTTSSLSQARFDLAGTSVGNLALFAGGSTSSGISLSARVDIFAVVPEPNTGLLISIAIIAASLSRFRCHTLSDPDVGDRTSNYHLPTDESHVRVMRQNSCVRGSRPVLATGNVTDGFLLVRYGWDFEQGSRITRGHRFC
jgi:hypothetical protein